MVRDTLVGIPIDESTATEVAEEFEIMVNEFRMNLLSIDHGFKIRGEKLIEKHEGPDRELGKDAIILQVPSEEWDSQLDDPITDELRDSLGTMARAVREVHNRIGAQYGLNIGPEEAIVMWVPEVSELFDAGLSINEARVWYLRSLGLSASGIAEEMGLSKGTIKSTQQRVRDKRSDAEQLLDVLESYEP